MLPNMQEAQEIINGMFKKYWHGDNPIFDRWNVEECPTGRDEEGKIKSHWRVKWLLDRGYKVKAGYTPSGIRGARNYYILWK